MKKYISLFLIAVMTASLVACGFEEEDVVEEVHKDITGIKMVVNGTLAATADNGQAEFEKQWEEAVGLDLQIVQLEHSSYNDAIERIFASEIFPDVMIMSTDMYSKYATTGILWDMTEAYNNADFKSRITYPSVNESLMKGGRLYGIAPTYGNGCVTYVKKAWLDAVGIDPSSIKNFDDYYNMLLAFKEQDPDKNKEDGTYGVVAAGYISDEAPFINYLPEFWQDAYPNLVRDANGTWYDGFNTEATKAAINRIAKGVADCVIDPATEENDTKQARMSWFSSDQSNSAGVFSYWAGTWCQTLTDELIRANVKTDIIALKPIEEVGAYLNREAHVWVIIDDGDDSNDREQQIFDKFFETMLDGGEVQTLWTYGAKGVHWDNVASPGFTINAGTENEKSFGPYEDGEFYLLPSPMDSNTIWKKNTMDPALVIAPLTGKYVSYNQVSELATEGNKFFMANMKDAPILPVCDSYSKYADEINAAKEKCILSVVNDGVSVDDAMITYVLSTKDMIDACLKELNADSE